MNDFSSENNESPVGAPQDLIRKLLERQILFKREVESYVTKSETEFLSLGEALKRSSDLFQNLVGATTSLIDLSTGSERDGPIARSRDILLRDLEMLMESVEGYRAALKSFSESVAAVSHLIRFQEDLKRSARPLTYIPIYLAIESVILSQETSDGFMSLQSDMKKLSEHINRSCDSKLESLTQSREVMSKSFSQLSATLDKYQENIAHSKELILSDLAAMERTPAKLKKLGAEVTTAIPLIQSAMQDVVIALQGHDSMRQRLSHVLASMDLIEDAFNEEERTGERDRIERLSSIRAAERIQRSQVEEVRAHLDGVSRMIESGLRIMVESSDGLAEEASSILRSQSDLDRYDTAAARLEKSIRAVGSLFALADHVNEIYQTVSRNAQSIRHDLNDFTDLMKGITLRLRIISVNIQIQAARVSQSGAMNVLGERARSVSIDTLHSTERLAEGYAELDGALSILADQMVLVEKMNETGRRFTEDSVKKRTEELRGLRRGVYADIRSLAEHCQDLRERTLSLLDGLRFHQAGDALLDDLSDHFQSIDDWVKAKIGDDTTNESESAGLLSNVADNYSMASERRVHRETIVGRFNAVEMIPKERDTETAAEFGDNVELF